MQINTPLKTTNRINLLLLVLLLINPVIIYLLVNSIWLSFLLPFVLIVCSILLAESHKLKSLYIVWFNVLLVNSFFLHAEAIFTYRFPEYIIEDLYSLKKNYYFNQPYLNKTFQDKEYLVQYKTNAQGFRIGLEDDPDVTVENADWLFIGDSYTQGAQVEYEELYTSRLNENYPDKIIINAGISGLGIVDEYYYYISEGKNLKANKVFLQICNFNDFMHVSKRSSGFSDYLMHYSNFARYLLYGFKYANPAELPLGRWTEPFYPDEKSNRKYNIFYKETSDEKERDIANFEIYLKKFAEAVRANGAELIIIQIPTKEQIHFKYLNEVVDNFHIDIKKLDMHLPNNLLANMCATNAINHIDLLEEFSNNDQSLFFDFDEHLNILGHIQIAENITKAFPDNEKKSKPEILSRLNIGDRYPVFSREDSNILTFQSWRDGNMELFVSDSLLKEMKRLTWNKIDEIHPWPSPDGNMIVFTEGDQSLNRTKVALMDINGRERLYLTPEKNTYGAIPSFDWSGNKIAYAEWLEIDNKLTNPYLVIYDLSTKEKTQITSDKFESWRPIFSPDNERVYYIAKNKSNVFDIYEYSISNETTRNLTQSNYDEWDPAVSKDGKRLVYAGKKNGNWDLFMIDLDSGKKIQLTESKGDEWDPSFSNDGAYLYYAATYGLRNGIFRIPIN